MKKTYFRQDLTSHFEKIEDGKPVHFKRFLLGLAEAGISPNQVDVIFQKRNIGKKRYRVKILPESLELYKKLKSDSLGVMSSEGVSEKVLAAAGGRSHSKSASGAYALIHTQSHQVSPFCVMLDSGIPRELPKLNKKLLLIENMELFLRYKEVIELIRLHGMSRYPVELSDYDVMYSQGSVILNKQYRPLLMAYERIDCLFDLDFGGIIVYSTLQKHFKNTRFLKPEKLDGFMERYGFCMSGDEVSKLIKLNNENKFTKDVKELIRILTARRQKLEQEVYLLPII